MNTEHQRKDDDRIDKIFDAVNAIHLNMTTFHQKCAGDMALTAQVHKDHEEKINNVSKTLYNPEHGLCKVVQIDHERISVISKVLWTISGATIVLIANAIGKHFLK